MSAAKNGDRVRLHYVGRLDSGKVFEDTRDKEPLQIQLGEGQAMPAFEKAVLGMQPGETKTVHIGMKSAYGQRRKEFILDIPRAEFPEHIEPVKGKIVQLPYCEERMKAYRITSVNDQHVVLDGNPPLAGKDLNFEIQLLEILPSA